MNRNENIFNILSTQSQNNSPTHFKSSQEINKTNKRKRKKRKGIPKSNSLLDGNTIFSPTNIDDSDNESSYSTKKGVRIYSNEQLNSGNEFDYDGLTLDKENNNIQNRNNRATSLSSISTSSLHRSNSGALSISPSIGSISSSKLQKKFDKENQAANWTSFIEIQTTSDLKITLERIVSNLRTEFRPLILKEWILFLNDQDLTYMTENELTQTFKEVFIQSDALQLLIISILRELPSEEEEALLWELFSMTLLSNSEDFPLNLLNRFSIIHRRVQDEQEQFREYIYNLVANDIISRIKQTGEQRKIKSKIDYWTKQINRVNTQLHAIDQNSPHLSSKLDFEIQLIEHSMKRCIACHDAIGSGINDISSFENLNDSSVIENLNRITTFSSEFPQFSDWIPDNFSISKLEQQTKNNLQEIDYKIQNCKNKIDVQRDEMENKLKKKEDLEAQLLRIQEELQNINSTLETDNITIQRLYEEIDDLEQQKFSVIEAHSSQIEVLETHSVVQADRVGIRSEITHLIEDCNSICIRTLEEWNKIFNRNLKSSLQSNFNLSTNFFKEYIPKFQKLEKDAQQLFNYLKNSQNTYEKGSISTRTQIENQYKQYLRYRSMWNRLYNQISKVSNSIKQFKNTLSINLSKELENQIQLWDKIKLVKITSELPWINLNRGVNESDSESIYSERYSER